MIVTMRNELMNLWKNESVGIEPWWVTLLGCVVAAIVFALALVWF